MGVGEREREREREREGGREGKRERERERRLRQPSRKNPWTTQPKGASDDQAKMSFGLHDPAKRSLARPSQKEPQ